MADYRLYFIDRLNHIRGAVDVEAIDDRDAIAKARAHGGHEIMEVWQGGRQVRRLEPPSSPEAEVRA